MKKSIFLRIFATISCLILVILIIYSGVITTLVYNYSIAEKSDILSKDASKAADAIKLLNANYSPALERVVMSNLMMTSQMADSNIIVTNAAGQIIYSTDQSITNNINKSVSSEIVTTVKQNGTYSAMGSLGNMYKGNVYTVGKPVTSDMGEFIGAVFVSTATPYIRSLLLDMIRIMLNSAALIIFIALIVAYIITRYMTRPLKSISNTVREYAKGNFSQRVQIDSHDELGELATAFNNMASSLQQLETMRNSFIANVSHDLKTPMTTIAGFVDGILDGTIPPEKQNYYLKIVADEVRRLSRMVKGLLDLAKLESNPYEINRSTFDLCEMVGVVLVGFEQRIKDRNIYVEVFFKNEQMNVNADHDMIFQVIYNLIDNAFKFVNDNGIISVRIEQDGKKTSCYIKNTGKGISPENIERIFERFYKSDESRGLDKKGFGLGLYIVKLIITAHGEQITVNSVENEFTEFSFTLPTA